MLKCLDHSKSFASITSLSFEFTAFPYTITANVAYYNSYRQHFPQRIVIINHRLDFRNYQPFDVNHIASLAIITAQKAISIIVRCTSFELDLDISFTADYRSFVLAFTCYSFTNSTFICLHRLVPLEMENHPFSNHFYSVN